MKYNWRCALGLHPWAKWGAVEVLEVRRAYNPHFPSLSTTYDVTIYRQTRVCTGCGRSEIRDVKA
jgi:hypothetical protein